MRMITAAAAVAAVALGAGMAAQPAAAIPTYEQLRAAYNKERAAKIRLQRALVRERTTSFRLRGDIESLRERLRTAREDERTAVRERNALAGVVQERDSLRVQVGNLIHERDAARGQVATAQSSVDGAVATMSTPQLFALVGTIFSRFGSSDRYDASVFTSGTYRSYTFTRY